MTDTYFIPPGTAYLDLPKRLILPCCPGKSCGTTKVYLSFEWMGEDPTKDPVPSFSYRRNSNDDVYRGPWMSVEDLITDMNEWAARNAEYL